MAANSSYPAYFDFNSIDISDFEAICAQQTELEDYPLASTVIQNVVIYSGEQLLQQIGDGNTEQAIKAEFCHALKDGPGVFIIKGAYPDLSVIDRMTDTFREIVSEEKANGGKGDHFGSNERIWNSIQKACIRDPETFIPYYGNPLLALACEAWLGPYYRISAQMNNVKPHNSAQSVHRDYHLGFQSRETTARFPAHAQVMSQYLTLQGAIAHVDMPAVMGPTLLLPYSHQYEAGYLAYELPEFIEYFAEHKVQLPFEKGDMVFFSPALFHGAGTNTTHNDRLANLVQISSAFGRTMETINTQAMIEAVYPLLLEGNQNHTLDAITIDNTIAAVANGYSFPTNLDSDPPIGGNAPETEQDIMRHGLQASWSLKQVMQALANYNDRRQA